MKSYLPKAGFSELHLVGRPSGKEVPSEACGTLERSVKSIGFSFYSWALNRARAFGFVRTSLKV